MARNKVLEKMAEPFMLQAKQQYEQTKQKQRIFTEFRYAPFLGGFSLELAYESQTTVAGSFSTPPLVIRTGESGPAGRCHP